MKKKNLLRKEADFKKIMAISLFSLFLLLTFVIIYKAFFSTQDLRSKAAYPMNRGAVQMKSFRSR